MGKKVSNHVHKLRKHRYPTGNAVFFCILPDCHFKLEAPLALGKRSLCNICDDEFVMTEYSLKLIKPHCGKCGKVKVKDAEGKARYVKKIENKILADVASNTEEHLKNRLAAVTGMGAEDDI